MKSILLARVSSNEQEDGQSIPAQTTRLREYAEKNRFNVEGVAKLHLGPNLRFWHRIRFLRKLPTFSQVCQLAKKANRCQNHQIGSTKRVLQLPRKLKEYKDREQEIARELQRYTVKDTNAHITANTVLSLVSRVRDIFESYEVMKNGSY